MTNFLFKLMRPAIKNGMMTLFNNHRDKITMSREGLTEVKDFLKDILDEIIEDIIRKEKL